MKQLHTRLTKLTFFFIISFFSSELHATTYYVSSSGSDANNGTASATPWKTLSKVSGTVFNPGDNILFNSGDTFTGQLTISSSGSIGLPVIYGKYGIGSLPYLAAQGATQSTIYSLNKGYFELNDLKVTNYLVGNDINDANATRLWGINIVNQDGGTINYIHLNRMEVTGVNSEHASFTSRYYGGVFFDINGTATPSKWNDILIDGCNIHDMSRTGVGFDSDWEVRSSSSTYGQTLPNGYTDNYVPSTNIVIRNNKFEHITGNGLIVRTSVSSLCEKNYFNYCGEEISGNAAFCFNTDNFIFQFNEAENTINNPGDTDARGFDSDYRNKNTLVQYNYLHDNGKGGFVATGGPQDGTGYEKFNKGLIFRYNIVEDNLEAGIVFSGNLWDATVYNNVIFSNSTIPNVEIVNFHAWVVFPHDVSLYNNIFWAKGSGAKYVYGDVRSITFNHNLYSFTTVPQGLPVTGYNSFTYIAEDNFSVLGNPLFNLPGGSANGYKLTAGSPAFNVGRRGLSQPALDYYNNTIGNTRNIGVDQAPGLSTTIYQIDINDVNSITKPDWTGIVGAEGNAIAINGSRFTMFGGIQGTRDRGTAGELTRDFAFKDGSAAGVGIQLEYLPAGTYDVNTWHYDPGYSGLVNVEFREMGLPATTQVKVTGKSLTSSASTSFQITVADGKDYEIIARENSSQDRCRFNGIKITPATTAARSVNVTESIEPAISISNNLKIFPNPVTSDFTLLKNILQDGKLNIKISDMHGRTVYAENEFVKKGTWQFYLNKRELKMAAGIYIVSVNLNNKEETISLLVH